jgi:carbamoyltransferase
VKVLGIWDGHDASAAITVDGRLVAAISEERLTRKKMQRGFPTKAIAAVLEVAEVAPSDLDSVAVAGRTGRFPMRLFSSHYHQQGRSQGPMDLLPRAMRHYENLTASLPGWRVVETALSLGCIRRQLTACGIPQQVPLFPVRHHAAHAFAGASMLPEGSGVVWTMDGYGDGLWATATRWADGQQHLIARYGYRSSPAVTYGSVSQLLGFKEGEEGKVTALAAHGDPTATGAYFRDGPLARGGPLRPHEVRHLKRFSHADIAAGLQRTIEEKVVELVAQSLLENDRHLVLSGGLFANVSVNLRLVEALPNCSVQVFPAMGDGGLSVGAAMHTQQRLGVPMVCFKDTYLGPHLRRRFHHSLLPPGVRVDPSRVPEIRVAELLARGCIVALVDGRDEFGPRALGNRSLLFAATDPTIAKRVQEALGRNPIMPFAPICRARNLDALFLPPYPCPERADRGLSFMTFAMRTRPDTAKRYPVAVHVDGTSRIQSVTRGRHRYLYRVLTEYEKRTGNQLLMNTSFNLHGEPIVHDLPEALAAFQATGCDAMLVGRRLIIRNDLLP